MRAMSRRTSRTRARLFKLAGRRLKAQVESCSRFRFTQLFDQLVVSLDLEISNLGHRLSSQMREVTKAGDNLDLDRQLFSSAAESATAASGPGTPSSSNRIRPGLTRAAQYSGEPLPLPMRTSAGFATPARLGTRGSTTALTADVTRDRTAGGFDLARGQIRSGSMAFRP